MNLTCDQLDTLLPEFMGESLTLEQQGAAAEHLAPCDECRVVVEDLRGVGALYREHGRLELPDDARERIVGSFGLD